MFKKTAFIVVLAAVTTVPLTGVVSASTPSFGLLTTLAQPLNFGDDASTQSTSCPSAGNCTAAGFFYDVHHHSQAFVVDQTNYVWHAAKEIGADINVGHYAAIESVSCSSVGNCAASGFFRDALSHQQAMVVTESHGVWAQPANVTAVMNVSGHADLFRVSCARDNNCVAVGWVGVGANQYQSVIVE
jgi:hypothetical protein